MSGGQAGKMSRPRVRRELMQVAKLVSTGWSWLPDWTREVSARMNSCQGGRWCCSKNVVAQFIGLASLSLRGARFLACASEQAPQSPPPPVFARSHRRRSNLANCSEIATPRQVGARNDKSAWCWMKETAIKIWRRDLQEPVSSLVLAPVAEAPSDLSYRLVYPAGQGRGWLGLMSRTTICAREASSTRRAPVGRGRQTTPQMFLGWSKNRQSK